MIDLDSVSALVPPLNRLAFKTVLRRRRMRLGEVVTALGSTPSAGEVERALDALEGAGFVAKLASPLREYTTYYITASGLSVAGDIRL